MLGRKVAEANSGKFAYEGTTPRERALGAVVALALTAGVALLGSLVHPPHRESARFDSACEAIVVTASLLTAWLLFAQFTLRRYAPIAVLAAGFAAFGLLHATELLIGIHHGSWLPEFARLGFGAAALGFVVTAYRPERGTRWHTGVAARAVAVCAAYVSLAAAVSIAGRSVLPSANLALPVASLATFAASAAIAIACGLSRRLHLWLAVVLLAVSLEGFAANPYVAESAGALAALLFFVIVQVQLAATLRRAARNGDRAIALHDIVSLGNETSDDRNAAMLECAAADLGFDWACLAKIGDGWITLETSVGAAPYPPGTSTPVRTTWVRDVHRRRDVSLHARSPEPVLAAEPPTLFARFTSLVTVPVFAGDDLYGVLGFVDVSRRETPLDESDLSFLRLLGALAGVTIQRTHQRRKLNALAYRDALTGLPNRAALFEKLQSEIGAARRSSREFAVHFLDLDGFKQINDTFGHAAGDEALREVALRLQGAVRESDTVARLGGDEFVVLQPGVEDPKAPDRLAARLKAVFEAPISCAGRSFTIGTSIGTSRYPRDGDEIHALLDRADAALYRIKARRRKPAARRTDVSLLKTIG
jgi:diguanylate cyclase (GGDEF)-like protein